MNGSHNTNIVDGKTIATGSTTERLQPVKLDFLCFGCHSAWLGLKALLIFLPCELFLFKNKDMLVNFMVVTSGF